MVHVLADLGVGQQAHAGLVQAHAGQRQRGGDVGVLGVELGRLAGRALEDAELLLQAREIADLLGRSAAPGHGGLAARVDHVVEPAQARGRDGVDAADGARDQLHLGLAGIGRGLHLLGHAGRAHGADGRHDGGHAARKRRQHMLLDRGMAGAFHDQVGARIGRQRGHHLGLRGVACHDFQGLRLGGFGHQHPAHLQARLVLEQFEHAGANGAATDQSNVHHFGIPENHSLSRCWRKRSDSSSAAARTRRTQSWVLAGSSSAKAIARPNPATTAPRASRTGAAMLETPLS